MALSSFNFGRVYKHTHTHSLTHLTHSHTHKIAKKQKQNKNRYLTEEDLVRRHVRQQEILISRMRESTAARDGDSIGGGVTADGGNGKSRDPVTQSVIIMDLNGLSLRPDMRGMSIFKACLKIDRSYYPERLYRLFIINEPWVFKPLKAILWPFLDAVTKQKFRVLGSDYASELLEIIAPDQLPVEFGGTLECKGMKWGDGCVPVWRPYEPSHPTGEE